MEKVYENTINYSCWLESLLEKMSTYHNNPKNSLVTKINKHKASGYSLFTHCPFDTTKNSLDNIETKIVWKTFHWN